MVSLPYNSNIRYLTGMDWVIHTLNYMSKSATGVGNWSQVVLELDGVPGHTDLEELFSRLVNKHPVIRGCPVRDLNLAPYWNMRRKVDTLKLNVKEHNCNTRQEAILALSAEMNTLLDSTRERVIFHLAHFGKQSLASMIFDHRLLDASGAETLLEMAQCQYNSPDHNRNIALTEPAHLTKWKEKFEAGRRVNQVFLKMAKNSAPVFPLPTQIHKPRFKFEVICLDSAQSERVINRAYREAGYLMLMPYTLAATIWSFHRIFTKRHIAGGDYVIPVSIDVRSPETAREEVFFNPVSFLMFRVSPADAENFTVLLKIVTEQMYDQIKKGLPHDLEQASLLMRILPIPVLSLLMKGPFKGIFGSFSFSCTGETVYNLPDFMGTRVTNIFHMPRVPMPPGLGIFFNQFRGKLNVTISHLEGLLDEEEMSMALHEMLSRLGVE